MADTIFLIHGMGTHEDGWHAPVEARLRALYANYPRLSGIDFDERFEIVPLEYDSVFRALVQQWQQNADALGDVAAGVSAAVVENLIGWLKHADVTDDNFAWTHAADVLLYRLFYTVRQEVKTHVGLKITNHLLNKPASASWSVIAHSLGTAVTHDTLDMLWTGQHEDGSNTGFAPQNEQAELIAMVANVSRVLQTNPKAYDSTVSPGAAGEPDHGTRNYFTFRHELDPFTIPKMFRPIAWPDADAASDGIYLYNEIDHVHQVNVHDILHYLDHPRVHIPLFRALTFDRAITQQQEADAIDAFPTLMPGDEDLAISIRERLEEISPGISETWQAYRALWDALAGVINEF